MKKLLGSVMLSVVLLLTAGCVDLSPNITICWMLRRSLPIHLLAMTVQSV